MSSDAIALSNIRQQIINTFPKVEPYYQEIVDMLCSNWSINRVISHLSLVHSISIPDNAVAAILNAIPTTDILPPSTLQEQFNRLDVQVDAVGEMGRILRSASDRLGTALLLEKISKSRLPYVDTAMSSYFKMLKDYVKVRQELGELPLVGPSNTDQQPSDAKALLPSLAEILSLKDSYDQQRQLPTTNGSTDDSDPNTIDGTAIDVTNQPQPQPQPLEKEVVTNDSFPGGPQTYTRSVK